MSQSSFQAAGDTVGAVLGYEGRRERGGDVRYHPVKRVVGEDSCARYESTDRSLRCGLIDTFLQTLRNSFLPVGFPQSVKPEYLTYQAYDSLQALCSYLRGVLCVHAILVGAGVGQESGNALSAAITWVMRDGIGMVASILFASSCSTLFSIYVKEWRLFADVINDVGQLLDMLSAHVPSEFYLAILSMSAICKAFCGVAAGSTKLCITNHLACENNAGDLATKEGTQETAVTLLGLLLGMLCAQYIASDAHLAMALFLFLTAVHVWANYRAVFALQMESINPPRCLILARAFFSIASTQNECIASLSKKASAKCRMHLSRDKINSAENLSNTIKAALHSCKIHLGCPLSLALSLLPSTSESKEKCYHDLIKAFLTAKLKYCMLPRRGKSLSVLMLSTADSVDYFQAFVHCIIVQSIIEKAEHEEECPKNEILKSVPFIKDNWTEYMTYLKDEGWDISETGLLLSKGNWTIKLNTKDVAVD